MSARFQDHLTTGDHASRPLATDVPVGALYSCTTHSLIYQSDGASWSTWATLGSTIALDDLTDVNTSGEASGNVLGYNGSGWVPTAAGSGVGAPNVRQAKFGGTGAITGITLSDTPVVGNTLLMAFTGSNSGFISALACTNVTWTLINRFTNAGGIKVELYAGAVGSSPGTAITFTNPNSFESVLCIEVDAVVSSTPVAGLASNGEMNADTIEIAATTADHLIAAMAAVDNTSAGNWTDLSISVPFSGINRERISLICGYSNGGRAYAGAHGSPVAGGVIIGEIS